MFKDVYITLTFWYIITFGKLKLISLFKRDIQDLYK